jgi:hypothetical protein
LPGRLGKQATCNVGPSVLSLLFSRFTRKQEVKDNMLFFKNNTMVLHAMRKQRWISHSHSLDNLSKDVELQRFWIFNRFHRMIERREKKELHPGLLSCEIDFVKPYPSCNDLDLLSLATMSLLIEFAYPAIRGYSKFTIAPTIITTSGDVSFTAGPAIPLTSSDGNLLSESEVYAHIERTFAKIAEIYDVIVINRIYLRIYTESKKDLQDRAELSLEDVCKKVFSLLSNKPDFQDFEPPEK